MDSRNGQYWGEKWIARVHCVKTLNSIIVRFKKFTNSDLCYPRNIVTGHRPSQNVTRFRQPGPGCCHSPHIWVMQSMPVVWKIEIMAARGRTLLTGILVYSIWTLVELLIQIIQYWSTISMRNWVWQGFDRCSMHQTRISVVGSFSTPCFYIQILKIVWHSLR